MAKIASEVTITKRINAPLEAVRDFLRHPEQFMVCIKKLAKATKIADDHYLFELKPEEHMGRTISVSYSQRFHHTNDTETFWESGELGNTKSKGSWRLRTMGVGTTEIEYNEHMEIDTPLPRLLVPVAKPIAAREMKKEVEAFLQEIKEHLENMNR